MVVQPFTLADFLAFAALPENESRTLEFINGEIVEVSPGCTTNSAISHLIVVAVHLFCRENGLPCYTSGEAGAYQIGDDVFAPDFAYKPTPMIDEYPDPVPPLWAVEIISPNDRAAEIRDKRNAYLKAGILLWEIYPKLKTIDVYGPDLRTVGVDGVLDAGSVLPGFTLPAVDLFGG